MFYPDISLDKYDEIFNNPSAEYRGAPFWAWNKKLDITELTQQITYFQQMGMGGFHMHCRTGLDTEYMGDEFLSCIMACVDTAKEKNMRAFLYDEDRWPSGSAGGRVTKEEEFCNRYLVFTAIPYGETSLEATLASTATTSANGTGKLIARYEIILENGLLLNYRLKNKEEADDGCWYLYLEHGVSNPWFNNQPYVDTLNKRAIERFLEETHEKYYSCLSDDFGSVIPSIFTDEPQFAHKTTLGSSKEKGTVILPYTESFGESFLKRYGEDILTRVPELIWEKPENKVSLIRYRYHEHLAEHFTAAFADTVGEWCGKHGIYLTGHMMDEATLEMQTRSLGEAMRSYRSFQLPGIDMLLDGREYTTAKQAQSAAHQYGREGVLSELYGVTNWDFDFRGHKLQGDWQAALGITLRVHHLSWVSMTGEAKRDYPASIFYQSPWYKEYKWLEDHFARVNTALTRGKPHVRIGVIHPIETYWLHFGPNDKTRLGREELDKNFQNVTEWLLFANLDFDFIAESLLPELYEKTDNVQFHIGGMEYDVVIVPGCETLRRTTVEALESFLQRGGHVVFMGEAAEYVDAMDCSDVCKLSEQAKRIPFTRTALIEELVPYREIEIREKDGTMVNHLLTQMRMEGNRKWLFIANGRPDQNRDIPSKSDLEIRLKGLWTVTHYDTLNNSIEPLEAEYKNGDTIMKRNMFCHDSLLLALDSISELPQAIHRQKNQQAETSENIILSGPVPIELSEPNVLLLDLAEFSLDDGEWKPKEEILKIDNVFRKKLGWPQRMEVFAQPWVEPVEETVEHMVALHFYIESEIEIDGLELAMEEIESVKVLVNGLTVEKHDKGYFTDRCIQRIELPGFKAGINILELVLPFTKKTNLEWCYLLGNFGVVLSGCNTLLTKPVERLSFGDYCNQGLPFYAGNVTYHIDVEVEEGSYRLNINKYRAPLLNIRVDDEDRGHLAFAPYNMELGVLTTGKHRISITSYGNRVNAFGAVHNCDENTIWFGPNAWRTSGDSYSYEYQLKRMGVLKAPVLKRIKN